MGIDHFWYRKSINIKVMKIKVMKKMIRKPFGKILEFDRLSQKFGFKQSLSIYYQLLKKDNKINVKYYGESFFVNSEDATIYHLCNSIDKIIKMVDSIPIEKCTTILDIGANCGLFSLFAKTRFSEANVYAFEPSNFLHEILVHNLHWRNVEIIPIAISNTSSDADFFINQSSQQTNSLIKTSVDDYVAKSETLIKQKIKTMTLDSFLKERGVFDVDVIKLDVQGAEALVVEGGKNTFSQTRFLLTEVSFLDNSVFNFIEILHEYFPFYKVINPVHYGADILFSKEPCD